MCAVHGWAEPCKCGYAVGLAVGLAAFVLGSALSLGCSLFASAPEPCSASDVSLLADEAQCLARVKAECKGVPLDEPCPFEEDCKARTRERCK